MTRDEYRAEEGNKEENYKIKGSSLSLPLPLSLQVAAASRIEGITPAAIVNLLRFVKKRERKYSDQL